MKAFSSTPTPFLALCRLSASVRGLTSIMATMVVFSSKSGARSCCGGVHGQGSMHVHGQRGVGGPVNLIIFITLFKTMNCYSKITN